MKFLVDIPDNEIENDQGPDENARQFLEFLRDHVPPGSQVTVAPVVETEKPNGGACPKCGSGHLEGGFIEVEGNTCFQQVTCHDCESTWTDTYELVSQSEPVGEGA
jgi:hypothetical protein